MDIKTIGKSLGVRHNVSFRVLDEITGEVISTHIGHNSATNSLLTGIGHYLKGDGVLDQGWHMLSQYVPKYISLGTMGLLSQDEDAVGLPSGIGVVDYSNKQYGQLNDDMLAAIGLYIDESVLAKYPQKTLQPVKAEDLISDSHAIALRYIDYLNQSPGFGADGYSTALNNNRTYLGIGPTFANRVEWSLLGASATLPRGDIDGDGSVTTKDLQLLLDYLDNKVTFTDRQRQAANVTKKPTTDRIGLDDAQELFKLFEDCMDADIEDNPDAVNALAVERFGQYSWQRKYAPTINCELVSDNFPRAEISYRDIIPENEAEFPKTLDVVFGAMISTGALAQFREPGRDYIFITEAGLWSNQTPTDGGDNGFLAGYRIAPPNRDHWDMQVASNRTRLQKEILKVGKNQVVQVIWKIQLGSIDQFEGIQSLYPSTETLKWLEHGSLLCNIAKATLGAGWQKSANSEDLRQTYDGLSGTFVQLAIPENERNVGSEIIYELDDSYDLTEISIRLSRPTSKLPADEVDLGYVEIYVSTDGSKYVYIGRAPAESEGSLNLAQNAQHAILSFKGLHGYINIKYVSLKFYGAETVPLAEISIRALDSTLIPENTTSLKWNIF